MTIDNGIFAYNTSQGIFTLDRLVEDTSDISILSVNVVDGKPVVCWFDGTNYRINHVPASLAKSSYGIYKSNAFLIGGAKKGRIKTIKINHKPLPASCGFTVKVKHYGHYTADSTPPTEDSFTILLTPQGKATTSGLTQSTDNSTFTILQNHNLFKWADFAQLEIDFDEISGVNAPSIIETESSDSF
jgi:hypothetical protein